MVRVAPPDWLPTSVKDCPKSAGLATEPTLVLSHSATIAAKVLLALLVEASSEITPVLLIEKARVMVADVPPAPMNGGVGPKPVPLLAKLTTVSASTTGEPRISKVNPPSPAPLLESGVSPKLKVPPLSKTSGLVTRSKAALPDAGTLTKSWMFAPSENRMSPPVPLTQVQSFSLKIMPGGAINSRLSVSVPPRFRPSTRFESWPSTPRPPPLSVVMLSRGNSLSSLRGTIFKLKEVLKNPLLEVVPAVPPGRSNWLTRLTKVVLVLVVEASSETAPVPSMLYTRVMVSFPSGFAAVRKVPLSTGPALAKLAAMSARTSGESRSRQIRKRNRTGMGWIFRDTCLYA